MRQIASDGMCEDNGEGSPQLDGHPQPEAQENKAPHVGVISMGKGCKELPVKQSWSSLVSVALVSVATSDHLEEAWLLNNRES